jgi:pimeloyl-ACP methyl ester carboxylesterase
VGGFGLIALAVIALIFGAGLVYQKLGKSRDARTFPPPGRMIDIGGLRLHAKLSETASTPPVILEAGIAATSLSWGLVEKQISQFATVLSYDRAGLGWSEPSSKPRTVPQLVDELRALLSKMNVAGPRVIAAHSFGGLIALDYAARFPDEVAGLVLIDPPGIAEWADPSLAHRTMLRRGVFLSRFGEVLARMGVVRFALNRLAGGSRRMPKMIARATGGGSGQAFTERMVGEIQKLPRELWPAIQAHWCDPKCFGAMATYLKALPESAAWVLREAASIRAPLTVLSAANASASQRADQERVARLSARGRVEVVEGARHWIQLDRPDLVARAVREACSIHEG